MATRQLSEERILQIARTGEYFFPASAAYPHIPEAVVNCDRCNKANLKACIHLGDRDLCLSCTEEVVNISDTILRPRHVETPRPPETHFPTARIPRFQPTTLTRDELIASLREPPRPCPRHNSTGMGCYCAR